MGSFKSAKAELQNIIISIIYLKRGIALEFLSATELREVEKHVGT